MKLEDVTKAMIDKSKVRAINTEDHTRDFLSYNFAKVEILEYGYSLGIALESIDPIRFRQIVVDEIYRNLEDKNWVEIEGEYYSREDINKCFQIEEEEI